MTSSLLCVALDGTYQGDGTLCAPHLTGTQCCVGTAGNVDCDPEDVIDISDLTYMIDNLFISLVPFCCDEAGNADDDPNGDVDISDLTRMIDHLFITLAPLPPCQ
ncbi:MAG: hypothetical protein SGI97_04440 [candidate division Zixibacteria bacterium]|nr:hypothetical protein [candidate division Zixibacteria bacterium]